MRVTAVEQTAGSVFARRGCSTCALSDMRFRTLRIASLMIAATIALEGAAPTRQVADDPVTATMTAASPTERSLVRITRDYNNDDLEDLALAWLDSCGNRTCAFALFLRRPDGRYARVGDIGGLPFGFRIVPLSRGRARWETCAARGEEVTYLSLIVSTAGIDAGDARPVAFEEAERLCKWTEAFTWEECSAEEYRRSGTCQWRKRSWPDNRGLERTR
jgi:hypothetical protein